MELRKTARRIAAAFAFTLAVGALPALALEIHVAPGGDDSGPGTKVRPFATLERARDAARAGRDGKPVDIVLHGGVYHLERSLVLTPEDGGTKDAPVTWRAAEGERVVLRAGREITGWKPWRDGIFHADLKPLGLAGVSFHQLFLAAAAPETKGFLKRQILARYPDFDPDHPLSGGYVYNQEQRPDAYRELRYAEGAIPFEQWDDISQAEVVATYAWGWMFAITPIEKVDTTERVVTFRRTRGPFYRLNRFFIQNVLGALDAPGEWYLDRDQSVLYFRPPDGVDPRRSAVVAPVFDHIVEVRGEIPYPHGYLNVAYRGKREDFPVPEGPTAPVEHIRFVGLDFEVARQDALRLTGARHCEVVSCRFTNVGNIGVNLGGSTSSFPEVGNPRVEPATGEPLGAGGGGQILLLNDPCVECRVAGCDLWEIGNEGIMLFGTGNVAENNHVYDIGLYAKDCPCINLLGEANVARRNTLHDCPRCAVFLKGVDNVVELNDVHHAVLETTDMGAIRMVQRNEHLRGNIIRHNRVTDTIGYGFKWDAATHFETPFYTWSIYLDDFTCGTTVYGNICTRSHRGGVMLHGGGDNRVANNVLVNAGYYQVEFAPIGGRKAYSADVFDGNRVERNVLVCTQPGTVPYRWTSRSPASFKNNLIWSGGRDLFFLLNGDYGVKGLEDWLAQGMAEGTVVADPQLEERGADMYVPARDSPAWKLGFEPIPVDRIGCYRGAERVSWPIEPNRERDRETYLTPAIAGFTPPERKPPTYSVAGPVDEGYENDTPGQPPQLGDAMALRKPKIVVTDERAASGRHSLKIVDAPGQPWTWVPRIFYPVDFGQGTVVMSLDLWLDGDRPPTLYIDPREYGPKSKGEFLVGAKIDILPSGEMKVGSRTLTRLPMNQWIRIETRTPLGEAANGKSEVIVATPGADPERFTVDHLTAGMTRLDRIVISSNGDAETVFYLDNFKCDVE